MHRSLPFRIVGGPQRGGTLWLSPAVLALLGPRIVYTPHLAKGADGTVLVTRMLAYAIEPENKMAVFQMEEQTA